MSVKIHLALIFYSCYLYSGSHPDSSGWSMIDLSKDTTRVEALDKSPTQLVLDSVIRKVYQHYSIPLEITESIRTTFKSKLWRMGKVLCQNMVERSASSSWRNGANLILLGHSQTKVWCRDAIWMWKFSRISWICPSSRKYYSWILHARTAPACACLFRFRGCGWYNGNLRKFYSRNTQMPAIRENFLPRNKPAIR